MISTRYKIILLFILNIGVMLLPVSMFYINILLIVVFGFIFKREVLCSLKIVILYLVFLFAFSVFVKCIFSDTSLDFLLFSSLKVFTIISLSILLVFDLNIMELLAFLTKVGVPAKISLSIGVGFRYIGLLIEDIKRINFIQSMNGFGINIKSFRNNGFLKTVSVFSLPLFLSLLKRTENISLSILMQNIEQRSKKYNFRKTTIAEIVIVLISIMILFIGVIRKFNN